MNLLTQLFSMHQNQDQITAADAAEILRALVWRTRSQGKAEIKIALVMYGDFSNLNNRAQLSRCEFEMVAQNLIETTAESITGGEITVSFIAHASNWNLDVRNCKNAFQLSALSDATATSYLRASIELFLVKRILMRANGELTIEKRKERTAGVSATIKTGAAEKQSPLKVGGFPIFPINRAQ